VDQALEALEHRENGAGQANRQFALVSSVRSVGFNRPVGSSRSILMVGSDRFHLRRVSTHVSPPETLASAVEAKSRFLASGVDSRGKKGPRVGSLGRELA